MGISIDRIKRIIPRVIYEGKGVIYHSKYSFRKWIGINRHKSIYTASYVRENIDRVFVQNDKSCFDTLKNNRQLYSEVIQAADATLNDKFYVLHEYYDNLRQPDGHYKWHSDIFSGFTYFVEYKDHYSRTVFQNNKCEHQDLKGPWEFSRLQFLIAPALAWNLTGKNEYADKVVEILDDWIKVNKLDEGPNWNCAMEAGIRVVNMLLAYQLIADYQDISDFFANAFIHSVEEHLYFILWNLENYAGHTYNHYLGDVIGVLSIVTSCPFLSNADGLYVKYKGEFEKEIARQIMPDGGDFEGSACYHCLVGEMFALAALVVSHKNDSFSKTYYEKLTKMVDFSMSLRKELFGLQPQIGDNDSGRVIEIIPHRPLNYDWFLNLSEFLIRGAFVSKYYADLLSFMTGEAEIIDSNYTGDKEFPDFGVGIIKKEQRYVILSGVEAQKQGLGGHTHNDKLSVEIGYKGIDFIVDPGSGVYTSDEMVHHKFRSIYAHSTLIVNESEQNEGQVIGFFGNSYDSKCNISISDDRSSLVGSLVVHNKTVHYTQTRIVELKNDSIEIIDDIDCESTNSICINFVIAPGVEVSIDGYDAVLKSENVAIVLNCGQMWDTQKMYYSSSYGVITETVRLYAELKPCEKKNKTITKIDLR